MKLIHKLRLLGIACVFALLCYLAFALISGSFSISLSGGLLFAGLGALGALALLYFGVSSFLNRHSGKPSSSVGQGWLSTHTLKNGVQVLVSRVGHGRSVRRGRVVVVHYSAYHTEVRKGTLFDTTSGRAPLEWVFGGGANAAWTAGLEFMKAGAKARLIVPPKVGFGISGATADKVVPPNATIIFDIEVVAVKYSD